VGKEIGRPAEPEFEAVIVRGETLNLDPDAFGRSLNGFRRSSAASSWLR
jgi:hypothetical protein